MGSLRVLGQALGAVPWAIVASVIGSSWCPVKRKSLQRWEAARERALMAARHGNETRGEARTHGSMRPEKRRGTTPPTHP
jgi:hypothetical protein